MHCEYTALKKHTNLRWLLYILPLPLLSFLVVMLYVLDYEIKIDNLLIIFGITYVSYLIYLSLIFINDVMSIAVEIRNTDEGFNVKTFSGKKHSLDKLFVPDYSKKIINKKNKTLKYLLPKNGSFVILDKQNKNIYLSSKITNTKQLLCEITNTI